MDSSRAFCAGTQPVPHSLFAVRLANASGHLASGTDVAPGPAPGRQVVEGDVAGVLLPARGHCGDPAPHATLSAVRGADSQRYRAQSAWRPGRGRRPPGQGIRRGACAEHRRGHLWAPNAKPILHPAVSPAVSGAYRAGRGQAGRAAGGCCLV